MKILVTVVSGLFLAAIIGVAGIGYKVNTLEAKVPALEASFRVSNRAQEKKDDRVYAELKAINGKDDSLSIIMIKLSNSKNN